MAAPDLSPKPSPRTSPKPLWWRMCTHMTPQVLLAVVLGALYGHFNPEHAKAIKPVSDAFINLVKMVIGPVVFLTVSLGVASMGDLKRLGRVGGKTLLYFEVVTTLALAIGLFVVNWQQPGAGVDHQKRDEAAEKHKKEIEKYKTASDEGTALEHALALVIPKSIVKPFVDGETLQIVFIAMLVGLALSGMGSAGKPVIELFDQFCKLFFRVVGMVMHLAPIGAFAAMAYTVGSSGIESLQPLLKLMGCVYLTMVLFIFIVLGAICRICRFSIVRFLIYIRDEILLVLGTSSSETALPRMMSKLERAGCGRSIVELVIPAGYSFNLDGTSIYLSMATIFVAQMYGVQLSWKDQLIILALLMLTSKGAAGVTGSGFIVLASTISSASSFSSATIPVEGLAMLLGVDRFMSEARAITNLIGNGVATMVIAKSEGEFDQAKWERAQSGLHEELDVPDLPLESTH